MTEAPSAPPNEPTPGETPAPKPTEKQPPWGKPENFTPEKAWDLIQNLRNKEAGDATLRTELEQLRNSQQEQATRLASALGVKPEETSDADRLASEIDSLRKQVLSSERRAIAIESKIPDEYQHMLTATDAEGLRKQAADLVAFAQAAHYAAATTQPPPPPPAFQANPGQGQGGAPMTPEAEAAAEYEKYYPTAPKR